MCGIVGIHNLASLQPVPEATLRQMLAFIRHRGQDQFGIYLDEDLGLGSARLSIIDLLSGQQPITNESRSLWIVFNGEIFNYVELRPDLEARGHRFTTNSDTEVILHLYEDLGPECLGLLNGQFALAIWDARQKALFLARDRLGVRPLFYSLVENDLVFGSEIKAVLAEPRMQAAIDPIALDQIFTYWSTLSPRTVFQGVQELPPGHYLLARNGKLTVQPYWRLEFPVATAFVHRHSAKQVDDYLAEFRELLVDATRIRLRADVPVGAYLSGGLDSSAICAIIRNFNKNRLETFSIAFSDLDFDESQYQRQMARFLGTDHHTLTVTGADIGHIFPEVIWHTETPILRTSPAPLFLLSKLVHDRNLKVVLTGEGADEFLAGYDIFKEVSIRRFWARQPESYLRPLLLQRLYPYISDLTKGGDSLLIAFFRRNLEAVDAPEYSHTIRWQNTSRTKRFFSDELSQAIANHSPWASNGSLSNQINYPDEFHSWDPLNKAQYLEISIFLSQYLLSSQGDRMGMAHSVEGRFPFLDHRVVDFSNRLPAHFKLHALTEKYLLKKLARDWLPEEIWRRPKRPYRAPIHTCFFNPESPDYVAEILSPERIKSTGLFKPAAVQHLVRKIESGLHLSETDNMALAGILSTQLVHHLFVDHFDKPAISTLADDVKVCLGQSIVSRS